MSRFALRVARDTRLISPDIAASRRHRKLMEKSCSNCRRHRQINGTLRCEEPRSNAIGGVIILDVAHAVSGESFELVCAMVAARCSFYQTVS